MRFIGRLVDLLFYNLQRVHRNEVFKAGLVVALYVYM